MGVFHIVSFGGRQDDVAPIRFASGTDGEAVIIGTVRAVRRLSDASCPSCRIPFTVHIQGAMEQAEAGHAAADQVCMTRDDATMFDELRAIADRLPSCTPTGTAGSRRMRPRLTTELEQARRRCTVSETSRPYVGEPEPIPEVEALAAAEAMARLRRKGGTRMFRLSWPVWRAR